MSVYLDYNATAPLRPEAAAAMAEGFSLIGNPSSIHGHGRRIRREIEAARETVAGFIHADPIDIVFTSGATEANNAVLRGAPVQRWLVSAVEHPSVMDAATNTPCATIPVTSDGVVDLAALDSLLGDAAVPSLISVMWVNNETGVIQPIAAIASLARKHGALFHCDAVQAAGKVPIDMRHEGIDFLTLSAHKIGGPSGIGALVYGHHLRLAPHMHGGGQERRRRAGTENLLGLLGFAAAAKHAALEDQNVMREWRDILEKGILDAMPHAIIAGQNGPRVANTCQIILPGVAAETQLMSLDLAGYAVSSGAACSSGSIKPSHVLLAMGFTPELARCAIRVSMGYRTTRDEVMRFLAQWVTNAQRLSKK